MIDFKSYSELVKSVEVGKILPDAVYVHQSALDHLPKDLALLLLRITKGLKIPEKDWNIAKFLIRDFRIALLHYPDFDNYAYPSLHQSTNIDLEKLTVRKSDYSNSSNPPILHRKETFVAGDYEHYNEFCDITKEGEKAGLFEKTRSIGFKNNWERLIRNRGLRLDEDGRLLGESEVFPPDEEIVVHRHLTAIDRNKLSAPMQLLAKHGYLEGDHTLLDYGCGKGDDVRELEAHGLDVASWDPVYHPEGDLIASDIVNLGFVINVIEEKSERDQTILRAFELTKKAIVISAMVAGESVISQFTPYKDGVVTSKNTFQKYFSQSELKHYIEQTLALNALALGQGIFIVFKDVNDEQEFLLQRQHYRRSWNHKSVREPSSDSVKTLTDSIYEKHEELLKDFWSTTLDLGRCPSNQEFEFSQQIRQIIGSHKKAFDALIGRFGEDEYKLAKRLRKEDLLVYFALGQFEKRKPYKSMPERLKRDLKAFFESYDQAISLSKELLFSLGAPELIEETSLTSFERIKCGEINAGHSFVFHKNYLCTVTPELRTYVGCAAQLYGDIGEFDLVKAHFTSGKVSFMKYDSFEVKELPLLLKRVKVKLKELDFDTFLYGDEFKPLPLKDKRIYLGEMRQ